MADEFHNTPPSQTKQKYFVQVEKSQNEKKDGRENKD